MSYQSALQKSLEIAETREVREVQESSEPAVPKVTCSKHVHAAINSFSPKERAKIDSLLISCGVRPTERESYLADLLGLMEAVLDAERP